MGARLGWSGYGKSGIRLATVAREGDRHRFVDRTIDVRLEGDFEAAHVDGDNAAILPTDTMRGAAYALAKERLDEDAERFGLRFSAYLLDAAPAASRADVRIVEHPWERIEVDGAPHPHAFTRAAHRRTAHVVRTRDGDTQVEAGLEDLYVLKTTRSSFTGFLRDRFTTLEPAEDRILGTRLAATWTYARHDLDYPRIADDVRRVLVATFARHDSRSVQHTLHAMGQAVLEGVPEVAKVRLSMPNLHHVPVDLSPYGIENANEVFVVLDRPFGLIEGTVVRDGADTVVRGGADAAP